MNKFTKRVRERMHATGESYVQARAGIIADEAVAAFNSAVRQGDRVVYWPGSREGDGLVGRTRSEAWALGGTKAVVNVTGCTGCVALSHVQVLHKEPASSDPAGSGDTE